MERHLAAILMADIVGFSRLMGEDEVGTLDAVKVLWKEQFGPRVTEHHGRVVKLMGDAALVEFPSVVDAVRCAIATQRDAAERNAAVPPGERIEMRIGINLGDIISEGDDIYGDGVNVAARMEKLAEPGGVALSATAHEHAVGKVDFDFRDGGEHELKNIAKPVRVYLWSEERRLAAMLVANVAGFSQLMGRDETGTLAAVKGLWKELFGPRVTEHGGQFVKQAEEGVWVEFPSVVDAVGCAIAAQRDSAERNSGAPKDRRIELQIGVHLGEVIIADEGIHGDGVTVADQVGQFADPGGIALSATAYEDAAAKVDVGFDDGGEHELKDISEPVRVYLWSNGGPVDHQPEIAVVEETPSLPNTPSVPDKPSIAVLPFDNMSGDPEQEYFADGLTEDIITELSRFQTFFVIARNSSFSYKGKQVTVKAVGVELGVIYVLEGSVRKAGERVRITAQLVEASSGNHVWAERYDRELADVFEVQDEVTRCIVAAIPGRLADADVNRIKRKPLENLAAYDYTIRGRIHHHRATKEDNAEALRLLGKAIELDPEFAEAYAWQSCTLGQAQARGFGDNKEELFSREVETAEKALSLDENNITCQWNMCELQMEWGTRAFGRLGPRSDVGARLEQADLHHQKAFSLNPNDPRIVAQRGELLTWQGHPDEGADWARLAMRLDPYESSGRVHLLGRALHVAGLYLDAIEAFSQVRVLRYAHHAEIAACYAQLKSDEKAKLHAEEVLRLKPDFSISDYLQVLPFRESRDREHHREGLGKAGLPE